MVIGERAQLKPEAPHDSGTVTTIATDDGFYVLGRFAWMYKATVGECFSQTLRGPNGERA